MNTPLNDAINSNIFHGSFHTPGHSGTIDRTDITELSYSGNLLLNTGVIKESQIEVSKVYRSECCRYITQGATTAIHIALKAFSDKKILVVGDCHYSVFSAIRLFRIRNAYFCDYSSYQDAIDQIAPDVVYYTAVDYKGNANKLSVISDKIIYIVDEAHGAHYRFFQLLPKTALRFADIVIHSLHKTLPVPTGGAIIHFKEKYADQIDLAFTDIHSSSPSYYIMAKAELAIKKFNKIGRGIFYDLVWLIERFSEWIAPFEVVKNDDFTRLVITSEYDMMSVKNTLEKYGIFAEACYDNCLIFIVTYFNQTNLKYLSEILKTKLSDLIPKKETKKYNLTKTIKKIELFDEYSLVNLYDAIGRRSYRELSIYPPGTPFIFAGDYITENAIDIIKNNRNSILGLVNNKLSVLKYS
ncbi:MAG: hypothetical protein LBF68_00730 [Christensenellaceae bacterium]|jgi:arginine decarboxylase|nr:hypothetical protein [Christensenellaceae bacterium]